MDHTHDSSCLAWRTRLGRDGEGEPDHCGGAAERLACPRPGCLWTWAYCESHGKRGRAERERLDHLARELEEAGSDTARLALCVAIASLIRDTLGATDQHTAKRQLAGACATARKLAEVIAPSR